MRRLLICVFVFLFGVCLSLRADNVLLLSSAQGHAGDTLTLSVSLNNTDSVTALQVMIPLNTSLTYINSSATLNSLRSNGHQITASVLHDTLRIYVYSLSLATLKGTSGQVLSFRLRLGNEPSTYPLPLAKQKLSSGSGLALSCTTTQGSVTLLAPKIRINNPTIDFGHNPIRQTYNNNISITNTGNEPLVIDSIRFSDTTFACSSGSVTISNGASQDIAITYSPTIAGGISKQAVIYSNAINGNVSVTLLANPFSVNELHVVDGTLGYSDSVVSISLLINNM